MDEETLFTGRGAPARAHVETFSKKEGQRVGWAEWLQPENRDQGGPGVVLTLNMLQVQCHEQGISQELKRLEEEQTSPPLLQGSPDFSFHKKIRRAEMGTGGLEHLQYDSRNHSFPVVSG